MVAIFALTFSYYAGIGKARRQVEYLMLIENSDTIVLRQYGDTIVSAPIDKTKKLISRTYTVRKISAENPISFRIENIGPLTIETDSDVIKPVSTKISKSSGESNKKLKRDAAKNHRAP